jgi:hypothetical protein
MFKKLAIAATLAATLGSAGYGQQATGVDVPMQKAGIIDQCRGDPV